MAHNALTKNHKKQQKKPLLKRILKIVKVFFAVFALVFTTALAIFYIKRDAIAESIIKSANQNYQGTLDFDDLHFNPLVNFPNVSFTFDSLQYYEQNTQQIDSTSKPIIDVSKFHVSLDVWALIQNEVLIEAIIVEGGALQLVRDVKGVYNIQKALKPKPKPKPKTKEKKAPPVPKKKTPAKKKKVPTKKKKKPIKKIDLGFDLSLEKLAVNGVTIQIEDQLAHKRYNFEVESSNAALFYMEDSIGARLKSVVLVKNLPISDLVAVTEKTIAIDTEIGVNQTKSLIGISKMKMSIDNADFEVLGSLGFNNNKVVDITLDGYDNDMHITKLLLTQEAFSNIKQGDVFFEGKIKGEYGESIPNFTCHFGSKNLNVSIPSSEAYIKNMNVKGTFVSGEEKDLSGASLKIEHFRAELPGGKVEAVINLKNLQKPELDYDIRMSAKVDGFDKLFNLQPLEGVTGYIEFKDKYKGYYLGPRNWKKLEVQPFSLVVKDLSFAIPKVGRVDRLDLALSGSSDTTYVNKFELITGNTDISITGTVKNSIEFIFDPKVTMKADLKLHSGVYDLPEFLSFDPRIGQSFPYKIKDIKGNIRIETDVNRLSRYYMAPDILFRIDSLAAEIDGFLPPVVLRNGNFHLKEKKKELWLDFKNFDLEIAGSHNKAEYQFFSPRKGNDYMNIVLNSQGLDPSKLLVGYDDSEVVDLLKAQLNGVFYCDIELSRKRNMLLEAIQLHTQNASYKGMLDTMGIGNLDFKLRKLRIGKNKESGFFNKLIANGGLEISNVTSTKLNVGAVKFEVGISNGNYTFLPTESLLFGKKGKGRMVLAPFKSPAQYDIEYEVDQIDLKRVLQLVQQDEMFDGNIDLLVDIKCQGDNVKDILNSLDGQLLMKGEDVTLLGIELDKFINKFKRSQNFGLVDVGAVALAGPVGLAISKGSQYAMIATNDLGDSTHITQFYSSCSIENGNVNLKDFALATRKYRVATKGWYDIRTDSLDITFGIVDKKGCAMIRQSVKGHSENYETSKVNIVKTLFAPVTNLLDDVKIVECDPFYEGYVQHPKKK